MDGDGSFEFDIVGESHYQDALDAICGGKCEEGHELECVALLRREPHNKHDPNAIDVMINGRKVDHLSRTDARAISELAIQDLRQVSRTVGFQDLPTLLERPEWGAKLS
eukprot:jgi/Tetstr1/452205/TSEL_039241.t1